MAAWDPHQYAKFEDERTQPARDLLARVRADDARYVVDLGCGPGNSTALLGARWPEAVVEGIDSDDAMLAEARRRAPAGAWIRGDAATWAPDRACDVLFSNATLHWLDDHATLFPRLLSFVRPGGVLAVQMPRNYGDPSHTSIVAVASDAAWASRMPRRLREVPVHEASFYYSALAPRATRVEIWETQYCHVLPDPGAVVEWVKGTALRPVLDVLDGEERRLFLERYGAEIAARYPPCADGKVLFPFRRLFDVATR
jgi:trans-aconitate 2-methyltransferase